MFKKKTTFVADLISQGSWGGTRLGVHESTMELVLEDDLMKGRIDWDIPTLDTYEEIGLWFELHDGMHTVQLGGEIVYTRTLIDYDGIFSLPKEAVELIRSVGFIVPVEFE